MVIVKSVSISEELNNELETYNIAHPNNKIRPSQVFQAALSLEIKRRTEEREQE